MHLSLRRRGTWSATLLAAAFGSGVPARAFVQWDESRNQLFFAGSLTLAYDSNIYAAAGSDDDFIITARAGTDFVRRAGLIGVDASAGWSLARFADNEEENFHNPFFRVELTKSSGRTTGSLVARAERESRAEPAVNLRTDSWNYEAGLHLKYPVIERYTIGGSVEYDYRDYVNNPDLVDLETFTAATDLFYVYTSERDLLGGYRFRRSSTSAESVYEDHAFTVGVSGKILPKLSGLLRWGYQYRFGHGPNTADHSGYTAAGAATWSINQRASLALQVAKDFGTTSSNVSIENLGATLDGYHVLNARIATGAGIGLGEYQFLGPLGRDRLDTYFSAHADAYYTFSERLRLALTYAYYVNWSTVAVADFTRHTLSLTATTRF